MNTKLFLFIFSAILLLSTNRVLGDDIHKETYNGVTLTEKTFFSEYSPDGKRRIYTVDKYSEKVDSIKKAKLPFSIDVKYPTWSSKQAFQKLRTHATECLRKKGITSLEEDKFYFHYLINDTGEIICYRLWTYKNLYESCTTEEIISIFDEISKFKFPVPITTWPKESVGYEMMSMDFF